MEASRNSYTTRGQPAFGRPCSLTSLVEDDKKSKDTPSLPPIPGTLLACFHKKGEYLLVSDNLEVGCEGAGQNTAGASN